MAVGDAANYILFANPIAQGFISVAANVAKTVGVIPKTNGKSTLANSAVISSNTMPVSLWKSCGRNFVRIAGLSGAAAVIVGAIGSHKVYNEDKGESKVIFETANRFHFFHTLALLGSPLARKPVLTGTLFSVGTILFSGTLYYRAFTGKRQYSKVAPIGGLCLILAWLSLII